MHKCMNVLLAAALTLALCACGEQPSQPTETEPEITAQPVMVEVTEPIPEPTVPSVPTDAERQERLEAYRFVLQQFAFEHVLPSGEEIGFMDNSFGYIEENRFAIADVDGDEEDELILSFTTAPMAGMCEWVFGYDVQSKTVYQELSIFPANTYYTGGLVESGWSHNQGLGGEFLWPYTLMGYNPATRSYEVICHVDSWDASRGAEYEGKPFPEEIDEEGAGVVFFVMQNDETQILSKTAYEAWREAIFGSAIQIPLEYHKTTEENIASVGAAA